MEEATRVLAASESVTTLILMKDKEGAVTTTQREYLMKVLHLMKAVAFGGNSHSNSMWREPRKSMPQPHTLMPSNLLPMTPIG